MRFRLLLTVLFVFSSLLSIPAFAEISIIIDAGHGKGVAGSGACHREDIKSKCRTSRPDNYAQKGYWPEGKFTLPISRAIYKHIKTRSKNENLNVAPYLTRKDSKNIDFYKRIKKSMRYGANSIVSVHFNASTKHNSAGVLTFYDDKTKSRIQNRDKKFCEQLSKHTFFVVKNYFKDNNHTDALAITNNAGANGFFSYFKGGKHSSMFTQIERQYKKRNWARPPTCFLEVEFLDNKIIRNALVNDGKLTGNLKEDFVNLIGKAVGDFLIQYHVPK